MQKLTKILKLASLTVALCRPSPAASEYVLVNNNNSVANYATLYELSTKTGRLSKVSELRTGGQGFEGVGNLSATQQAISADASCIFALDLHSSDIAAFSKATGYKRVGSYFDQKLISGAEGDSVALSPSGRFLFASYSYTGNVGEWAVGQDCALTLLWTSGDETGVGPLEATPDSKYLLARAGGGTQEYALDEVTGGLTYIGTTAFRAGACARESACLPYGIQITEDGKLAIFAGYAPDARREHMIPLALTARITPQGLLSPAVRSLTVENDLRLSIFPFLSSAAYGGSGTIYFGVTSGGQYNPGVLTADFTEKPVKFTVTNSTVANPQVGNIAVTGNLMVVAQYPNQISVFRIKKNGSLKLLSTTTIDEKGEGLFSLSIFPNTR